MDNIQTSANKIKNIYNNLSYYDQYGGQIFLFIIITIAVFLVYSYCAIMLNIQPIKDDWANKRCNPKVIPFAGFINKPPNKSITEFTQENFSYCLQNILKSITGDAVQPLTYVTNVLQNLYLKFSNEIQSIRNLLSNIRGNMGNITKEIMGRAINFVVPLQQTIVGIKDMFGKIQGVLSAALFTSLGSYYALKSLLGSIVEFVIIILTALAVLIASLWILPFTWPFAAANTTIFVAIAIPLAIIVTFLTQVMGIRTSRIPELRCFDENTDLELKDGKIINIKLANIGDELHDGSVVTAKMKVDASNLEMYTLNDVTVSGCHIVKYDNKWLDVSEHPMSKKLDDYTKSYVYCINTTNKTINIKGTIFSDWDEVYGSTLIKKREFIAKKFGFDKQCAKNEDIHKYLDGGFDKNTTIVLKNGSVKLISNVNINDILENGERVYALVEIDGTRINKQAKYNLGNTSFSGGGKLIFFEKSLGQISTLSLGETCYSMKRIPSKKLYNLVTDKGTFKIGDLIFNDYNSCVDLEL